MSTRALPVSLDQASAHVVDLELDVHDAVVEAHAARYNDALCRFGMLKI